MLRPVTFAAAVAALSAAVLPGATGAQAFTGAALRAIAPAAGDATLVRRVADLDAPRAHGLGDDDGFEVERAPRPPRVVYDERGPDPRWRDAGPGWRDRPEDGYGRPLERPVPPPGYGAGLEPPFAPVYGPGLYGRPRLYGRPGFYGRPGPYRAADVDVMPLERCPTGLDRF